MGKTSKKYLDKNLKKEIWLKLKKRIGNNSIENYLGLEKILTSEEILIIEKRTGIICLLEKGVAYREISRQLDVSRPTISFVKKGLKRPAGIKKTYSRQSLNTPTRRKASVKYPAYRGKGRWQFLNN